MEKGLSQQQKEKAMQSLVDFRKDNKKYEGAPIFEKELSTQVTPFSAFVPSDFCLD